MFVVFKSAGLLNTHHLDLLVLTFAYNVNNFSHLISYQMLMVHFGRADLYIAFLLLRFLTCLCQGKNGDVFVD